MWLLDFFWLPRLCYTQSRSCTSKATSVPLSLGSDRAWGLPVTVPWTLWEHPYSPAYVPGSPLPVSLPRLCAALDALGLK